MTTEVTGCAQSNPNLNGRVTVGQLETSVFHRLSLNANDLYEHRLANSKRILTARCVFFGRAYENLTVGPLRFSTVRWFRMKREVQLVERIAHALRTKNSRDHSVRLGIGDDAAVLKPSPNSEWVVSCDAFVEDVHFRISTHPADSVGYKALMRATSDLAAMGATPRYYLLALRFPPTAPDDGSTYFSPAWLVLRANSAFAPSEETPRVTPKSHSA